MSDGKIVIDTQLNTKELESGISRISSIANKGFGVLKSTIKGVTTALAGAAGYSLKVGSDFEAQMSTVQAISGATGSDFEVLTEKAKEMGRTTKFTATEAGKAFEYMGMAGWKTQDMLNGIEGVMNLAAASGEDLARTSDIVTDAMTALGMKAEESTHFADVLAATATNSNTNVGMMGDSFKYVAPLAGALGFSCEDLSIALGTMANSGIKSSQAGTALRAILTNMSKPTKDMQGAMDKLGVSLTDGQGHMKSLRQIMIDLRSSFSKLSEEEKVSTAAALAGKYGMSGLLAIVNDSQENFDKLTNAIDNCNGAAQEMAETRLNNLQGQMTILKSATESLGIEFYESINNPLTDVVKNGIDMVNQLTNAFKADGLEGMVVKLGDILGDVAVQFANFLPTFIDVGVEVVNNFIDGLSDNSTKLADAGIKIVTSVVNGGKKIIPKVIDLGASIVKSLLKSITGYSFDREIDKFADTIKNTLSNAFRFATKLIKPFLEVVGKLSENLDSIGPIIIGVVSALKAYEIAVTAAKTAQALFNGVCDANPYLLLASAIAGVIAIAGSYELTQEDEYEEHNKLIDKVNEHCESYKKLGEQAEESMKKGFSDTSYLESLKKELDSLIDANGKVKDGYQGRVDFICKELQDATGIEIKQVDGVIQKYDELSKKIDETIQKKKADIILEALKPQYQEALKNRTSNYLDLEKLEKDLKELEEKKENIDNMWSNASDRVKARNEINKKINETKDSIDSLQETIDDSEKDIKNYDALTTLYAQGSYQTMYQMYSNLATGIKNGSQMTLDEARETLSLLRNAYAQAINDGNKETASQIISQYNQTMSELDPNIRETLLNEGFNWGKVLGDSTADGVNASAPNVNNATEATLGNAVIWGANGNTRNANVAGSNLGVGIANGFVSATPVLSETMENSIKNSATNAANNSQEKMQEIGENLALGVATGMAKGTATVGQAGAAIINRAIQSGQQAGDIHSPSRKTRDLIGKNLGLGVAEGIGDEEQTVKNTMSKLINSLTSDDITKLYNELSNTIGIENARLTTDITMSNNLNTINSINNQDICNKLDEVNKDICSSVGNIKTDVNLDGKKVSRSISSYMNTDLVYNFRR